MFFNLFNRDKEYISCEYLEYGIHFRVDGLFHCASHFHSNENNIPVTNNTGNIDTDFKNFLKAKQRDKKSFRKGEIIKRCQNCYFLKKQSWQASNKIKEIGITANRRCNSKCRYCTSSSETDILNKLPDLPIYDFCKKLYDKNMIAKDCEIQFGGGEPTLHFEFNKMIDLCIKATDDETRICVFTNGINYSSAIEKLIKLNRANIVISTDSGNSELYKKIKNVDKFNQVKENVKRYCDAQDCTTENRQVALKYIIIPEINDNYENITEFLNFAQEVNCHAIRTEVEGEYYKKNIDNKDAIKHLLKMMKFMKINAENMGFQFFFFCTSDSLYNKYKDIYNQIAI